MSDTSPSPQPPLALIAEATKRAGVIWIAIQGQDRPRPAWHIWRAGPLSAGAAYVVTGPGEQPLPGLAGSGRVTVIVPRGAGGGPVSWTAVVSLVEPGSGEWDEVIGPLVAGRLNAVLAEGETSPARRWARSGAVFRLAPLADDPAARNSRTVLSAASPAAHPSGRLAGHRQRRNSDQCGGFSMHRYFRSVLAAAAAGGLCLAGGAAALAATAPQQAHGHGTATPIQHVVVIFQENVSFDHYFGTYPHAANTDGNPFHAQPGTPSVNGLTPALRAHNPNSANPQRLTPAQALTCDQDHAYTAEQQAMDAGLMDKFVECSSADPALDALNGPGVCGHGTPLAGIADRCGYGQRLPFLLISPYAKTDYVSGTTADQTSLLAFIEDNWLGGQRTGGGSFDALAGPLDNMFSFGHPHFAPYLLDPATAVHTDETPGRHTMNP